MKKVWKRTLAMLLVVLMIGGAAPIGALAEMEWPVLPENEAVSWWDNGLNAVRTAASWLGDRFHGLSLRASAASVVTITSPSTNASNIAYLDVDDLGQVTWTCSSSLVASYRYTIIEINTSGETVLDIARNQWIGRNVMNLYAYEAQFNPSRRYKIWVGAYKDSAGDEIIDSGTSIFVYTNGIAPEVTTSTASNITVSSATLNGKLVKNNALPIEACGFVYSTRSTASALKVNSSTGTTVTISGATGSISNYTMSKSISGLDPDTTYYYRAYATNEAGIGYGTTKSFTTDIDPQTMPAITSVTASPASASQGTTFTFTVKANEYTEKVGLEIDGNAIAESTSYSVKNGTHTFSISYRIMSIGDDRQVVAYPYKGSQKLTSGTASTTVSVTESSDIGTPQVTFPVEGLILTSNSSLTVTWDATPITPDSYTVIVYRAGSGSIYRKTDVTACTCIIPAEVFSVAGNYSVEVYAIKEGYASDHPGGVEFIVEAETTDPRILSVEVDPPTGLPNIEYTFTVTANKYTSKIGIEVDGNDIGKTTSYTTVGTTRVFTIKKVISMPGESRSVVAYPYKSSTKLEVGTAETTLCVLDAPLAGVPTLITPQTGNTYDYYYDLPVRWTAPSTAPDSYKILLYLNGTVTYEATTTGTSYSIPSSKLKAGKSYSVEVYAVKAGYKQDAPAAAEFDTVSSLITPSTVTSASANKTSIAANEEITFTVVTSKTATELYMLAEDGGIAEQWTDSSLYTTASSKRTWTVTRTIHSEGERTLRFCAGIDGFINTESYKDVSITVTANEDMEAVVEMASSDATLTQGDSYTATWTCNVTPSSYTVIVYCNGNQIYTQKNYTSNSFTVRPTLLSEAGAYSVEVYPILSGYKSVWGAVELTVQPQVQSDVQIMDVSVTASVRANTDTFVCNVTTNAAAAQVYIVYETGGKLDLTYQYTQNGNKIWQLAKKLDTIGLRKMRVVACDSAGNESQPYPFTVSVLPNEIPWDMQYDPETGDLTISATAAEVGDSLNAAYAKIVVYEQGYKKDLVPEFNAQTIINNTGTYSKTWNVFTDLGLTSGQTYEIAVGYISTLVNYYGGHDRLVIARNGYKITPEYVDVPVVYSVEIMEANDAMPSMAKAPAVKASNNNSNTISVKLGEFARFQVVTTKNAKKLFMCVGESWSTGLVELTNYATYDDAVILNKRTWTITKQMTGLHNNRTVSFVCVDEEGRISMPKSSPNQLYVGFPANAWSGMYDNGVLTINQNSAGMPKYNDSNTYSLWIRNMSTGLLDYYNNDSNTILRFQKANANLSRSWDVASELHLKKGVSYEYGIRGKSPFADPNGKALSIDLFLGSFVCDIQSGNSWGDRSITHNNVPVCQSAFIYDRIAFANKNDVVSVNMSLLNSNDANLGDKEWVQIKWSAGDNGVAYIQRKYLTTIKKPLIQNDKGKEWFAYPFCCQECINNCIHQGVHKHKTGCSHKDYYIGRSGCGVFAVVNSINYLTGIVLNPIEVANWAVSAGHRKPGATYATLYKAAAEKYGEQCGVYYKKAISKVKTSGISELRESLLAGDVAILGVNSSTGGHIIAVVNCRKTGNNNYEYLVFDSYPSTNRKTYPDGEGWLTEQKLTELMKSESTARILAKSRNNAKKRVVSKAATKESSSLDEIKVMCYNQSGALVDEILTSESRITIPYSTAWLECYTLTSSGHVLSMTINGHQVTDGEQYWIGDSDTYVELYMNDTDENRTTKLVITKEIKNTSCVVNGLSMFDIGRDYLSEVPSYECSVSDNMQITLPRSVTNISLCVDAEGDYVQAQIYRNDMPIVDPSDMLIDETEDTDIRIVVTADSGDQKEYTLTIHKKQTLESDTSLTALSIYPFDDSDEALMFAPGEEIALPPSTIQQIIPCAFENSAFATSKVYVDGQDCSDGTPVEIGDTAEIRVVVTAEDGTTQEYTFPVHYKKYYTVTWNVNGNQTLESCLEGNDLTAMLDPTRTGYTFTGWSSPVPETMPAANLEFTALFTANTYTLTFNAAGGVCDTATKTVTFDAAYGAMPVPQRSGFVFDGWYAEGNAAVLNEQSLVQTASDQTLYADWTMLGDVLRDENIDLQDVALLTRYLAGGWDTTGIHVSAGDVNRDGEVNLKDAVLIRRYLAGGWNVELI